MKNNPSLEMLAGQMVMVGFRGTEIKQNSVIRDLLKRRWLGGVCLFDNASPYGNEANGNIASPEQVKSLADTIRITSEIQPFVAIDEEGGSVNRLKEKYGFIETIPAEVLGAKNDSEFTRQYAGRIARQLRQLNLNVNLAPDVDLKVNPDFTALGKRGRCISRDPEVAVDVAGEWIQAHHDEGILCTLKHYPGHGSATNDSHFDLVDVTETWHSDELIPFQKLIQNGYNDFILTAHIRNHKMDPDFPATLSHKMLTGLLRENLGFQGVILTDDLLMDAIRRYYSFEETIELAIKAGADMLVFSNVQHHDEELGHKVIDTILQLVASGHISESRLMESWHRIQTLKARLF